MASVKRNASFALRVSNS